MKITKEQLREMVQEEMAEASLDEAGDSPTMTKQDYELIASVLRKNHDHGTWETMVKDFIEALSDTNPNFDKERFFKAARGPVPTTRPRS